MFFEWYVRSWRYYCWILRASNGLGQLGSAKSRPLRERFRGYSIGTPVLKSLWAFQIAYIFAPILKTPQTESAQRERGNPFGERSGTGYCYELNEPLRRPPPLLLLPIHLPVGLAIGIKAITFTLLPSGFQFGPSDVPVRTAFLQHRTQVLPKLFNGRSAKKPVAVVDLEYNETRFEDDDMWAHRVVLGVRVLGAVAILLNLASRIGQKGPMSADAGAVLIRRKHVVGTDSD